MLFWAFFFATLKIFALFWGLMFFLKRNCILQTHLRLDRSRSQTVLKLFLLKILTCLMQATGTDRAAGYGMMLVSALIFVYYTIWVIFLVSCYPLCKFIGFSDRLWLLSSLMYFDFIRLAYWAILVSSRHFKNRKFLYNLRETTMKHFTTAENLARFWLWHLCYHGREGREHWFQGR